MVVNRIRKQRPTLSISIEAKDLLDSIRHIGQSYDGLIKELVAYWKQKKKEGDAKKLKLDGIG